MLKHPKEETIRKNSSPAATATLDLEHRSDEELLLEYRVSEDAAVFAELVSRYERELYNYLRRFLGDGSLAEDVFQATFLQVHVKSDLFESGRKFRPWLYMIATNQAIDAQRRKPAPDLRRVKPDLPAAVVQLVRSMLAKDPLRRPHSTKDLIRHLIVLEIDTLRDHAT